MGVWELPEGWGTARLGELVEMKTGFACAKKNLVTEGLPHLRPFNVSTEGELDLTKVYHIPKDFKENSDDYTLEPGHILFNNTNSVELIGKTAIVRQSMRCAYSNHITRLTVSDKSRIEPNWLALSLKQLWATGFFAANCNKWIGQAGFNTEMLAAVEVPLPCPNDPTRSLAEQRRIVARIEELFARIAEARRLRAAADQDAEWLMEAEISEAMLVLPAEKVSLVDVLSEGPRNGWSPKCNDDVEGIPVLKLGAVLGFRYDPTAIKYTTEPTREDAHYWLKPGDILISRSNTPKLVGHTAVYDGNPYPCIYPDLLMRMRVDETLADPSFVIYWLRSPEARKYIASRARGASSTMKKISQGDVKEIPFPYVPISVQCRIVEYLGRVQTQVAELQYLQVESVAELERLEGAVLARAFRGKL